MGLTQADFEAAEAERLIVEANQKKHFERYYQIAGTGRTCKCGCGGVSFCRNS